ncbi:MAG: ABC transporter permease [Verrucomicrobiota bacterium]
MRNVMALLRRELNAYFASVLGYVVTIMFLFVMGRTFYQIVLVFRERPMQMGPMEALFGMFWFPALFIVPAITMRLLSEEKRSGTIEMLMTAPVTDFQVVLAKYLGAVILYTLMWAVTGLYILILRHFIGEGASLDLKQILAGYICVLVMGQFFVAVGLLASALTKNQVIAAVLAVSAIFGFIIVTFWQGTTAQGEMAAFFRYVSPFEHIRGFSRGLVDLRPLVLYATGTVVALFATTRIVESRKWR